MQGVWEGGGDVAGDPYAMSPGGGGGGDVAGGPYAVSRGGGGDVAGGPYAVSWGGGGDVAWRVTGCWCSRMSISSSCTFIRTIFLGRTRRFGC